jgi:hypothetical protein
LKCFHASHERGGERRKSNGFVGPQPLGQTLSVGQSVMGQPFISSPAAKHSLINFEQRG